MKIAKIVPTYEYPWIKTTWTTISLAWPDLLPTVALVASG